MKKLFVMAAMVLSSVGAFAQQAAGTTTIQPKVGLNVSTIADGDWKAGFAAGAELQYQATDKLGVAVGALYSVQGFKAKDVKVAGMTFKGIQALRRRLQQRNPDYCRLQVRSLIENS